MSSNNLEADRMLEETDCPNFWNNETGGCAFVVAQEHDLGEPADPTCARLDCPLFAQLAVSATTEAIQEDRA